VFLAVLLLSALIPLMYTVPINSHNYPIVPGITPFPATQIKLDSPLANSPFYLKALEYVLFYYILNVLFKF
jgi:hypothetical protein